MPDDKLTRPLKDMVRESIFNIIEHSNLFENKILNSSILDLYSGSGSFGIESLSRGASKVVFCENYLPAFQILKKNLNLLNCNNNFEVFNETVLNFIDSSNKKKSKYDIIFIDPPYKEKLLSELLKKIFEANILSKKGIIIIHRHKNEKDNFQKFFKILEEKKYGISKIIFGKFI